VETIKRQIRNVWLYDCRSESVGADLHCGLGRMRVLSVTHSTAAVAVCGLCLYLCILPFLN